MRKEKEKEPKGASSTEMRYKSGEHYSYWQSFLNRVGNFR